MRWCPPSNQETSTNRITDWSTKGKQSNRLRLSTCDRPSLSPSNQEQNVQQMDVPMDARNNWYAFIWPWCKYTYTLRQTYLCIKQVLTKIDTGSEWMGDLLCNCCLAPLFHRQTPGPIQGQRVFGFVQCHAQDQLMGSSARAVRFSDWWSMMPWNVMK